MAKHKDGNYIKLSRVIFRTPELSEHAHWLYCVLSELEHRYTGKRRKLFFRRDQELTQDTGLSRDTLNKARRELIDSGLIELKKMRYISPTGKKSTFCVNAYVVH